MRADPEVAISIDPQFLCFVVVIIINFFENRRRIEFTKKFLLIF